MPADFTLTPERIAYFRKYHPGATDRQTNFEFELFRAYHEAKGSAFKSWDAAWRTWTLNAKRYGLKPLPIDTTPFYKPASVPVNPTEPEPTPEQRRENIRKFKEILKTMHV